MKSEFVVPTSVQTPDQVLFHRCPYCRRGTGDIHIDLQEAIRLSPPSARNQDCTMIAEVPDQPVVVFQQGIVGGNPCPHTLSLLVDICMSSADNPKKDRAFCSYEWDHPWLDNCDPLVQHLFREEVFQYAYFKEAKKRPSYRLNWPYQLRPRELEIAYAGHGDVNRRVSCEGWVFCCVNREGFFQDLDEAARDVREQ